MVIDEILKVIYAPHRIFREIVQNPKYLGPLLILVIFTVAQTGFYYVRASEIYSELTLPTGLQSDEWTENATMWQASDGVVISNNYSDFINGTSLGAGSPDYYGNSSIEFTLDNSQRIQIALADLNGSVDCSETGFKNMSLRIKVVAPEVKPQNATLFLYSLSDSNYFYYDLTGSFSYDTLGEWNNITLPLGATAWSSSNSAAEWQNITGLMIEFNWANASNTKLRIDGLFFRGLFKNAIEVYGEQAILLNYALVAATPFLVQWLLLTGIMYLIVKYGLKGNVTWKPLMVAVGFALVTLSIQALAMLGNYFTLSPINVPLEYFAGVPGEFEAANQTILAALDQVNLISVIVQVAVWLWIIGLGAFIVRTVPITSTAVTGETETLTHLSWLKCMLVSVASFVLTIIIMGFLGI